MRVAEGGETADPETPSDEVVKSGDLALTATPEEGKKVISDGYTSYLDTLTLKASENVTVNSITLERYGYSTTEDVESIWLEDSAGNIISSEKGLSASKDSVTLSLKKDYRTFSDKDVITVVVKTSELDGGYISGSTTKVGTNIGFKVTAVDSSAKNLNLDNYSAYLYDIINYDGSEITVELKGKTKTYNVSPSDSYEVAKIKIAATNSAIDVDGFTLTNASGLDISDNIEKVEVKVDGNAVKGLNYTAKKDTLKVNFDKKTIGIKKSALFTVYVTLKEDFEDYGKSIAFYLDKTADLKAFETKTTTTVKYSSKSKYDKDEAWVYTFAGGKVTLTNTKLASSIDAAAGSEGVVVAQGTVKIGGEPINIKSLTITPEVTSGVAKDIVDTIKVFVDDEEFESNNSWEIKDILIEKDATIKVVVDLEDDNENIYAGETISFKVGSSTAISSKTIGSVEYDNSGEPVDLANIAGSINLSKIKVNESKAALKNSSTKAAEFVQGQTTSNKTLFDGTYTAKKSDIYLNEVALIYSNASGFAATDDVTITVEIDGTPVATMDASDLLPSTKTPANLDDADYIDFSDVKVKAGESVKVKVIASVYDDENAENLASQRLKLVLRGDDENGTAAGRADANTVELKITVSESVKITDSVAKKDVVLKDADIELAKFTVKPSNNSDEVDLTKLVLKFENFAALDENDIEVTIDDDPVNFDNSDFSGSDLILDDISYNVPSEGIIVVVNYSSELAASADENTPYKVTLVEANSSKPGTLFTRYVVPALVKLDQTDKHGSTLFTVDLKLDEDDATVTGLLLTFDNATTGGLADVTDESTIELNGTDGAHFLTEISYYVGGTKITIKKSEYNDYFVYGDTYLKIFDKDTTK